MNSIAPEDSHVPKRDTANSAAREAMEGRRFENLLLADWKSFAFLHFEVDPHLLQPEIPFALDLFEGRCFVSLVAFRMENMRFQRGGPATSWLTAPIANHHFLNLRTYVTHRGESGIFFVREWLDNRAAVSIGPWAFGLPYQFAAIDYDHSRPGKTGQVANAKGTFQYSGDTDPIEQDRGCGNPLDRFLLERYTAFCAERIPRFFRVWHEPWLIRKIRDVRIQHATLLELAFPRWWPRALFTCGHFSEGVETVRMGRPHLTSSLP